MAPVEISTLTFPAWFTFDPNGPVFCLLPYSSHSAIFYQACDSRGNIDRRSAPFREYDHSEMVYPTERLSLSRKEMAIEGVK